MASSSHNTFEEVDDESFDNYFDQYFDQTFENLAIDYGAQREEKKERKKRIHIERNREEGDQRLRNDYFTETPTYPQNLFRRRFRMNKPFPCISLIASPMKLNSFDKKEMLSESLVSLHFKSVQQPFVYWHMVVLLILLTSTSGSVEQLLGHV